MGPNERARVTAVLQSAMRKACAMVQAGEFGEPLGEILQHVNELVALADDAPVPEVLTGDGTTGITPQVAQRLAALEQSMRALSAD